MRDQNFKNLILDYPRESLVFFAAAEAGTDIHQTRITPIRQEQLKERLGARFRELDIPLLVEWPDGKREALHFVIEEESQMNRFSVHGLVHYCLDIAEMMKTNRVIPVVIFLNLGERANHLQLASDHHHYLEFNYLACDLKRLSADDYKKSENIVARLNLPNMRYGKQDRIDIYTAAQNGLREFEANFDKQQKYIDFIDYYADLSDQEIIEYKTSQLEKESNNMGLLEVLKREYFKEGREEGLIEGEKKSLLRLLTKRFQTIPDWALERITLATDVQIEYWFDNALDANSIETVFIEPPAQH